MAKRRGHRRRQPRPAGLDLRGGRLWPALDRALGVRAALEPARFLAGAAHAGDPAADDLLGGPLPDRRDVGGVLRPAAGLVRDPRGAVRRPRHLVSDRPRAPRGALPGAGGRQRGTRAGSPAAPQRGAGPVRQPGHAGAPRQPRRGRLLRRRRCLDHRRGRVALLDRLRRERSGHDRPLRPPGHPHRGAAARLRRDRRVHGPLLRDLDAHRRGLSPRVPGGADRRDARHLPGPRRVPAPTGQAAAA